MIRYSEAVTEFLEAKAAQMLSPYTLVDYGRKLKAFGGFLEGDPPLVEITPRDIRQFLTTLDGRSKKTVKNWHINSIIYNLEIENINIIMGSISNLTTTNT